jgi:hypothetical protein
MTNMKNLQPQLDEQARQDRVYEAAMSSIQASKRGEERNGYAVIAAAMGYGEGSKGNGIFGKISHAAQLFCIAFAFATPPLLVWYVLL